MQEIIYAGEHLFPGRLGHFCIILSFVSLLFSAYSYFKQTKTNDGSSSWLSLGRIGFYTHSIALFTLLATLLFMMKQQMYEYIYVQEHVSADLPVKYILSAFWEGQEGSFMLWMFWHAVMGILLIRSAGKWEAPVLVVLALVQIFINSMILGIHIEIGDFSYKVGSNPTLLLRETMDIPLFQNPDYVSLLSGNGLNPLLQNFWMTIHPPTVFYGFASVTVPFCYAIAGFWQKDYKGWLEPVLKWSLVSGTMLGLGIFMGCVWAYIALTFGGYWAWDPVENMSLVPWILMIAGIHGVLIAKSTGYSIKMTFIMFVLSFVTLLYSTFLTRSGVLGDTSVHAFTEMGLEWQLVSFIAFFALMGLIVYLARRKSVPSKAKEESIYSREFWMQIGVLVLLFSSLLISVSTSLPVYNKIMSFFDPAFIGKVITDPVEHHNKYQLWIGVFISMLAAKAVYLRYGALNFKNKIRKFLITNLIIAVVAGILCYLVAIWIDYYNWQNTLLSFASCYTIISSLYYLYLEGKFQSKRLGTVLSHAGFGIMLLGTIASGLNKKVISSNPFAQKGIMEDESLGKVVKLIKNKPFFVRDYWLTYERDTTIDRTRYFEIRFDKTNEKGDTIETFKVMPNVLYSNDYSKVAAQNPDTRRYVDKDIFTYVAALPGAQMDIEIAKEQEDSLKYLPYEVRIGDTIELSKSYALVKSVVFDPSHKEYKAEENDFGVGLNIEFISKERDNQYLIQPAISVSENLLYQYPEVINDLNIKVRIPDTFAQIVYTPEQLLKYQSFSLSKEGQTELGPFKIKMESISDKVNNKHYKPVEGDIKVSSTLSIERDGKTYKCTPVYIIRGSRPFGIKSYIPELGAHVRFTGIDPAEGLFEFKIAEAEIDYGTVQIEIAENVNRTDIIVLNAQAFPGINLFWLGCSMMIFGLYFAFLAKLKSKNV